jgi:hypothetical protein
VVEHQLAAGAGRVADVGLRHRHAAGDVLEQQHGQRLRQLGPRDDAAARLQQGRVHVQDLEQAHRAGGADGAIEHGPEGGFMQVVHGWRDGSQADRGVGTAISSPKHYVADAGRPHPPP